MLTSSRKVSAKSSAGSGLAVPPGRTVPQGSIGPVVRRARRQVAGG